jgi:hypothetical protein
MKSVESLVGGIFLIIFCITLLIFAYAFSTDRVLDFVDSGLLYVSLFGAFFIFGSFGGYYSYYKKITFVLTTAFISCIFLVVIHVLLILENQSLIFMMQTTGFNSMDILVWAAVLMAIFQSARILFEEALDF